MKTIDLLAFRKGIIENNIILSFEGKMSQGVLVSLVDTLKEKIKTENLGLRQLMIKKVFTIFVELAQNIQNHSIEKVQTNGTPTGIGMILIREDENEFVLTSGNNVSRSAAERLKCYCTDLNDLDNEQLKKRYKERLRMPRDHDKKGAGIGLIEMRRKSNNPLNYTVLPIDKNTRFFCLSIILTKNI